MPKSADGVLKENGVVKKEHELLSTHGRMLPLKSCELSSARNGSGLRWAEGSRQCVQKKVA